MRTLSVGKNDAGQRLDKYLGRIFPLAGKSFLYRMLRKKNILLNGVRADGSERVNEGDEIRVYFSEETFVKFAGGKEVASFPSDRTQEHPSDPGETGKEKKMPPAAFPSAHQLDIIYEDAHILLVNKPAGLLSQKARAEDDSLNDRILKYLAGRENAEASAGFTPSVTNRLDRNTSGLVAAGKTLPGQQLLSRLFRDSAAEKYYLCVVQGNLQEPLHSILFWKKDREMNTACVSERPESDAERIELYAWPQQMLREGCQLLKVRLISGKSHQIRVQLAHYGLSVLGDGKYGDRKRNRELSEKLGLPLRSQLLHAADLVFPDKDLPELFSEAAAAEWESLKGKNFSAPLPPHFERCVKLLGGRNVT